MCIDCTTVEIVEKRIDIPRINVNYPEIQGLYKETDLAEVNGILEKKLFRMIKVQMFEKTYEREVWGNYKLMLNNCGIVSVMLTVHSQLEAALHPRTMVKAINLDLAAGKDMRLYDIFSEDTDYSAWLNSILEEKATLNGIKTVHNFTGITSNQEFYITPADIVIFFNINQYTAYEDGITEFHIPLLQLRSCLKSSSPVYKLLNPEILRPAEV